MTSNFANRLDRALIRPGRIDIISEFGRCDNSTIIEMVEYFKETKLSETDRSMIMGLSPELFTPAELSKLLFENIHEPIQSVIDALEKYALKSSETVLSSETPPDDNPPAVDSPIISDKPSEPLHSLNPTFDPIQNYQKNIWGFG